MQGSLAQDGKAGPTVAAGWPSLGSQIGTSYHQPSPSGTGRYSVEQPHQSGICSVCGGAQPCRSEISRPGTASAPPRGHRSSRRARATAAGGVKPRGRGHKRSTVALSLECENGDAPSVGSVTKTSM